MIMIMVVDQAERLRPVIHRGRGRGGEGGLNSVTSLLWNNYKMWILNKKIIIPNSIQAELIYMVGGCDWGGVTLSEEN